MENTDFPDLPVKNCMSNNVQIALSYNQERRLQSLKVTELEWEKLRKAQDYKAMTPSGTKYEKIANCITAQRYAYILYRRLII